MEKLSNSESIIMGKIWDLEDPIYLEDILKALEDQNWAESTVRNFLKRIIDKGYLESKKDGRKNIYLAKVNRSCLNKNHKGILKTFYNNSLKNFIAELYDSDSIEDKDLVELKEYLDNKIEEMN